MKYTLENKAVLIEVDHFGNIATIKNKIYNGNNYVRVHELWRLIVDDEKCLEIEVIPTEKYPETIVTLDSLIITHGQVREKKSGKLLDISVQIKICIHEQFDDDVQFSISLENKHEGITVKEIHFPILAVRDETLHGVVTTFTGGQYFRNVKRTIMKSHTQYKGIDHHYIRDVNLYPQNAMNCMMADRGYEGLYYGCHDNNFEITGHVLELDGNRDFNMLMVRFPYIKCSQTYSCDKFIISPYKGDWKQAAKKYRNWADSWFMPYKRSSSLNITQGWQRIIMRTQCGEVLFGYNDLQAPFDAAQKAGIDTLFLFGWHAHGMDNGYPDYSFDQSQGGFDNLKKNIEKIQQQGGKIILYFNGQLIDSTSDFYQKYAGEVATKQANGDMEKHHYHFPAYGITALKFGNRSFTTACPSSLRWLGFLKECVDKAVALGVDAVFFDQIGNMPYPCHDSTHGHPIPYMRIHEARNIQLNELRTYIKQKNPNMGFGIEWLSDVTSMHVDFVHIWGNIAEKENEVNNSGTAKYVSFQEFFRYAFPEVLFSNREIRDESNVQSRVNAMLLKGCCSDVEIYRCQDTIEKTPYYQCYLGRANKLRNKFADILFTGKFLANTYGSYFSCREIFSSSWEKENFLAIMITQEHQQSLSVTLMLNGFHLIDYDSVSGDVELEQGCNTYIIHIPKEALCILLFEKIRSCS